VLDEALNAALDDVTGRSVNLALIIAVAALGCQYSGNLVDLRLHARRGWTPRHELLKALAQEPFAQALRRAAAAPLNDLTTAFCELVGAAINTANNGKIDAGLDLVRIAAPLTSVDAALKQHFDPALYFHAATKSTAIDAIRETEGQASAADAQKLGKKDLTTRAALTAKDHAWLPQVLREALAANPAPAPDHFRDATKMAAPDTRTTIQAMQDAMEATAEDNRLFATACVESLSSPHWPAPDEGAAPDPAARIANFLEWCCTRGPDAGRTKAQTLHDAFTQWDALRGHAPVPISLFGHTLEDLGVRKHRISAGVHYLDIALNIATKEAAQ
jgi:ParB family chromosome partitioning protein